ncbi:hypothetical protein [Bordetella bronchiseptica]|uniref:hypothetical protein n=1 Tax=Bordetella bronchiseptica TaxID=518 RepID=UPI001247DC9D|nr:hypothetical protein [Bordetella bronchiseptica]KAB1448548.1 hypothetical protein F7D00_08430 [Bordetella bronchiseptica]KAB1574870.1 hypothetical protein F7890_08430 [Bordetella bronchiseptica]
MKLAIDVQTMRIYMGKDSANHTMPFGSTVTQATHVISELQASDLPSSAVPNNKNWVFQELSFDPTSRLRRGNLYQPDTGKSWPTDQIIDNPPKELMAGPKADRVAEFKVRRTAYPYEPCRQLIKLPRSGIGATLALGTIESASLWRVVQAEISVSGAVLVTLKSRNYLGALPDVDLRKINEEFHADVVGALDRAADAAHRESPVSVIDQCRNALTVCLSRWLVQTGLVSDGSNTALHKDLGELAKMVPNDSYCIKAIAGLIARLHSRGKDNERARYESRAPDEDDADLAVQSLGFVLSEFGWIAT